MGLDWENCNGVNSSTITDDDDLIEFFYNEDYCYYTEWEQISIEDIYYDEDGNEYND
jgi:hypothetical protein